MKKTIFSLMAFGTIIANSSYASVPTLALTFDTNVKTYNMTSTQEAKVQKAADKIRAVIASDAFRTKVLNFTYNGVKKFVDNGGLTNAQIYQKILEASENYNGSKNNTMDIGCKVYYVNSSTVGYTTTGQSYTNMNSKYLNSYTSNQVARNLTHEWLHMLGFHHAVNYSTSRDYSVPYGIGKIMEQLAALH